jgi:hypothetical protein
MVSHFENCKRQKGTPPQISSAEADEIHPSDGGEFLSDFRN